MSLRTYQKKRKFSGKGKTSEPKGKTSKKTTSPISHRFIVHEHHASHLHWDLRLEMNGVLKSWAVPKTPPAAKGIKRLAMQVEDHPLEYIRFHGTIPEGNYGAGKVIIWDRGKYILIEKNSRKIVFELHGKKLKGKYCLVKTNYGVKKNGWLFFKL